uniref:AlNc14C232G9318 protein n=1 Tax=Albugo laibachii Nc14 TaxID=890382 RepID=F0WSH5_9STRA|nr:AlNc14C232G9318 [Albugo laibachii Nc14]|eukprot:CCA24298.1 AlNc14C232G9318 [Albugo laibachii Nc14]
MSQPRNIESDIHILRSNISDTVHDLQDVITKGNYQLSKCSQSLGIVNQALTAFTTLQETNTQLLSENNRLQSMIDKLQPQPNRLPESSRSKVEARVPHISSQKNPSNKPFKKEDLTSYFNGILPTNMIETDANGIFSSSTTRFGQICADIVLSFFMGTNFEYNQTLQSLVLSGIRSGKVECEGQYVFIDSCEETEKLDGISSSISSSRLNAGIAEMVTTAPLLEDSDGTRQYPSIVSGPRHGSIPHPKDPLIESYQKQELKFPNNESDKRDAISSVKRNAGILARIDGKPQPRNWVHGARILADSKTEVSAIGAKRFLTKETTKRRAKKTKQTDSLLSGSSLSSDNDKSVRPDNIDERFCEPQSKKQHQVDSRADKPRMETSVVNQKLTALPRDAGNVLSSDKYRVAVLDYYSRFPVNSLQYAQNNNNLRLRYQVKLRSNRYVTVKNLVQVLCAQPWLECRKRSPIYQMIDFSKTGDRLRSFLHSNAQLMNEISTVIAHWERQHWLILPKYEDWPDDHPDKLFFSQYERTRDVRHNHLKHKRVQTDGQWRRLLSDGHVATGILFDPAYFWITDTRAPWLPMQKDLIVDLIQIDYLHPSRSHFSMNPYASSFYNEQLDLIIPPPDASAKSFLVDLAPVSKLSNLFTPYNEDPAPQWKRVDAYFTQQCRTRWLKYWTRTCAEISNKMGRISRLNVFPRERSSELASKILQQDDSVLSEMTRFPWFRCLYFDFKREQLLKNPVVLNSSEERDTEILQDLPMQQTTKAHFWPSDVEEISSLIEQYKGSS